MWRRERGFARQMDQEVQSSRGSFIPAWVTCQANNQNKQQQNKQKTNPNKNSPNKTHTQGYKNEPVWRR